MAERSGDWIRQALRDLESARTLDRYYIPARYPNGWASGTPSEYITRDDARDAIGHSEKILRFCADLLAGSGSVGPEHP